MADENERDNREQGDAGSLQLADSSGNYTAARAASGAQQIALNGGVAVTGSGANPYPEMPKVSSTRPMLKSLGATGTAIFNGVVTSEEYNEDFYWKDAIRIYETMLRNDAQINAVRMLCELPIRRATWSIEPASDDPVDIEIASFVESCMMHDMRYVTSTGRILTQKWDDTLRHILLMLWFGFSAFEQVWRIEDGWVKWSRWLPLLPRTIWRWWVGEDNELAGIQQWTFKQYNYQFINIPADKLLLFVHRQEGQNYEGLPLLRTAYKHWWYKDNYYKIEAIDIERNAVPTPIIHLPENFTDADVLNANAMLANIRANESMGLTLPPGWQAEYMNAHGSSRGGPGSQMTPSIEHHDLMIARNVLGQFMNLGSDSTGSYALASTQVDMFLNALQAVCEYIEDVVNLDAIPRLVDYNYDGVAVYPKLKASKLATQDVQGLAKALQELAGQQPLITAGPELEDWIREGLGVPTAPKSAIETENPSDESAPGSSGEDEESSTVQGKSAPGSSGEDEEDAEGVVGGDATDAGAEMAESRLLREALDVAYARWDTVERAERWREKVAAR
jgi:hypothetical protein